MIFHVNYYFDFVKKYNFLFLTFLLLLGSLFFINAESQFPCDNDSSHYVGAAKSVLTGNGYTFNGRPETLFPPGLSLTIASIMYFFDDNYVYYTRYICICSILCLIFIYLYFKVRCLKYRMFYTLIIACSPTYFEYSTILGSDIIFMMTSIGFIYFIELTNNIDKNNSKIVHLIFAALLLIYAIFNRSVGMALVAAIGASTVQVFYRARGMSSKIDNGSMLIFLIIGLSFYIFWSYWTTFKIETLYTDEFRESYFRQLSLINPHQPDDGHATLLFIIMRILKSIPLQIAHLFEFLLNIRWLKPLWFSPMTIFTIIFMAAGLTVEIRRSQPLAGWYTLFYLCIILLWPYDESRRFILPIIPIIIIILVQGIGALYVFFLTNNNSRKKYLILLSVVGLAGVIIETIMLNEFSRQMIVYIIMWCLILLIFYSNPLSMFTYGLKSKSTASYTVLIFSILFLMSSCYQIISLVDNRFVNKGCPVERISLWIKENMSASAVLMSQSSSAIHFLTGRRTLPLPITGRKDILKKTVNYLKPDYFVINEAYQEYTYYKPTEKERLCLLENLFPGRIKKLYSSNNISIYKFKNHM
jgi:hypothetical protein